MELCKGRTQIPSRLAVSRRESFELWRERRCVAQLCPGVLATPGRGPRTAWPEAAIVRVMCRSGCGGCDHAPSLGREVVVCLHVIALATECVHLPRWQLLGAVNYLHKQSLSHGDICPANVLWRRQHADACLVALWSRSVQFLRSLCSTSTDRLSRTWGADESKRPREKFSASARSL